MLSLNRFDYKKAVAEIAYLAKIAGGDIDKLKLVKLLFFADRYHIRKYGRPIANDVYFAMKMGPVPSSSLDIIKPNEYALGADAIAYARQYISGLDGAKVQGAISLLREPDADALSESDIEALEKVSDAFKGYSPRQLVDITHLYPEWERHRVALENGNVACVPMSYADFFSEAPINSPGAELFADNPEVIAAARGDFEEHIRVADFWN